MTTAVLPPLPVGWSQSRLRFVATINPSKTEVAHLGPETEVSFVPMEAVGEDASLDTSRTKPISEVAGGYTYFRDGDILIAKITPCFENGKATLARGLAAGIGFGSTEFHVVRPSARLDARFAFYAISSSLFRDYGTASMYGAGGQKRVPTDFIADFPVPLPQLPEQRTIADFLDRETAKIDALIAKQEMLIERIEEKRRSFIAHAATKGLNADREFRDSGIEWIGLVPSRWSVKRVKHVAKLESGHTPSKSVPEYWIDCDIPWVSLNDSKQLSRVDYISDTAEKINRLGIENSSARLLPERAVVFTRDATVGLSAITTRPMAVSQHLIAWICGPEILPEYLLRVIYAMKGELDRLTAGATIKTIGMPLIGQLVSPIPPLDEQRAIVAAVEEMSSTSAAAIHACEEMLARLNEHRAALITAAVTGQIEVAENMAAEAAA